jgi:cytochrome P450
VKFSYSVNMDSPVVPSSIGLVVIVSTLSLVYLLCIAIYRLYFHSLSQIAGPWYAALTHWYQFYFDVVKRGRFPWELERMHKQYGPIVRIGPNEVHIVDPEFYNVLYAAGSQKRNKDHFALDGFGLPDAVLETGSHDLHRMRRAALSPYFSTQAIAKMEPVVHEKLNLLYEKLEQIRGTRQVVDIEAACMR